MNEPGPLCDAPARCGFGVAYLMAGWRVDVVPLVRNRRRVPLSGAALSGPASSSTRPSSIASNRSRSVRAAGRGLSLRALRSWGSSDSDSSRMPTAWAISPIARAAAAVGTATAWRPFPAIDVAEFAMLATEAAAPATLAVAWTECATKLCALLPRR